MAVLETQKEAHFMAKIGFSETFIGDFETTVFEGQEYTEVWASGLVKMHTENVIIHNNIEDTFNYLKLSPIFLTEKGSSFKLSRNSI